MTLNQGETKIQGDKGSWESTWNRKLLSWFLSVQEKLSKQLPVTNYKTASISYLLETKQTSQTSHAVGRILATNQN